MTQLNIFDYVPPQELPADHHAVYSIIERRRGKASGILQVDLANATGFNPRVVRQLVKELIEYYGKPIGSGSTGFFIPVTDAEVRHIRRDLAARAKSIFQRLAALDKSPDIIRLLGQAELVCQRMEAAA